MFHPSGLFKNIQCPKRHECTLPNCIFSHEQVSIQNGEQGTEIYDPFNAGEIEPPLPKRRRLESPEAEAEDRPKHSQDQPSFTLNQRPAKFHKLSHASKQLDHISTEFKAPTQEESIPRAAPQPVSIKRSISPPPSRDQKKPPTLEIEKLIPRPVARAPAVLKVRMSFTELLHKQMTALNAHTKSGDGNDECIHLDDQQIIKLALDEEEQAATRLGNDIYRNAMSQRVLQLKKMKVDEWRAFINQKSGSAQPTKHGDKQLLTSLDIDQEIQILRYLRTNLTGLDVHGYVTKPPVAADIQKAKEAVRTSGGYEVCDRCGTRFQVFPGRDIQGRLTTKGDCHYHWAKLNRGQWQRTDHITGQSQSSYPCCNRPPGSEGCTAAASHVFKVADAKRLAALLQFEQTPPKTDGKKRGPIAFDCEMAYTAYGMELIRVTAVSWPQNKELLDVLVRPFGEILDLNTRFSGVTQEQYTTALPYSDEVGGNEDSTSEEVKIEAKPLRKVESPAVARQLMFDLLTIETPLIGHAIDNDLNACRIIHPFVIDTVLLYPHPRGLPIRFGLKALTSKYLQRSIQMGGETGHDSKEDSIATGDLVRVKVAEKWQMMRLQGWKFNDDILTPPGR